MAGRKPKPTQLKLIQGTAKKCRINTREPKPTGDLETAPEWMSNSQKDGWRYAIEHAPKGLLKRLDQSALALWVVAEDNFREASQKLDQFGMIIKSPNGLPMPSPYSTELKKYGLLMLRAASELGFTPSSRARVVIAGEKSEDDPWASLAAES